MSDPRNPNRRNLLKALAGSSLAVASPALIRGAYAQQSLKGSGNVVVYDGGGAWGAAQKTAFFDPFESESGIKVIAAPQSPVGKVRASVQAGSPAYDIMDLAGGYLPAFVKDNLLEKIDFKYFAPGSREAFSPVPCTDYAVPALFYSLVLAYDKQAFEKGQPESWADMWNVERFPGKRAMYNAGDDILAGGVFETALLANGVAPGDLYPIDFDRAFKSLDRLKPHLLKLWTAGAEPAQLLTDGAVAVTTAWNGRITALQAKKVPVGLSWNQAILQWDAWAVLKGARNADNAMKFLAFAARPEAQAKFSELIDYGPTNPQAFGYLKPERAAALPANPDTASRQVVQNYEWWNQAGPDGKTNLETAAALWQRWITK